MKMSKKAPVKKMSKEDVTMMKKGGKKTPKAPMYKKGGKKC